MRWECPNGLHPAVLGASRPPADATVRFCLACSAKESRLVRRTAPALEREREERKVRVASKAERTRERARTEREQAQWVDVLDFDGAAMQLNAQAMLARAWESEELRARRAEWSPKRPRLTIRCSSAVRRGTRDGDYISGHAKVGEAQIVLTVGPGLRREWLEAIVIHEAAHSACPPRVSHGGQWRRAYRRALRELYGVEVEDRGQPVYQLDSDAAAALRDMDREVN